MFTTQWTNSTASFCALIALFLLSAVFGGVTADGSCFKEVGGNVEYEGSCLQSSIKLQVASTEYSATIEFVSPTGSDSVNGTFVIGGCTVNGAFVTQPSSKASSFCVPDDIYLRTPLAITISKGNGVELKDGIGKKYPVCSHASFGDLGGGKYTSDFSFTLVSQIPSMKMVIVGASIYHDSKAADGAVAGAGLTGLQIGIIAGAAFLVVLGLVVGLIVFFVCRHRKKKRRAAAEAEANQMKTAQERSPVSNNEVSQSKKKDEKSHKSKRGRSRTPPIRPELADKPDKTDSWNSAKQREVDAIVAAQVLKQREEEEAKKKEKKKKKKKVAAENSVRVADAGQPNPNDSVHVIPPPAHPLGDLKVIANTQDHELIDIVRATPTTGAIFERFQAMFNEQNAFWLQMPNKSSQAANDQFKLVEKIGVVLKEMRRKFTPNDPMESNRPAASTEVKKA